MVYMNTVGLRERRWRGFKRATKSKLSWSFDQKRGPRKVQTARRMSRKDSTSNFVHNFLLAPLEFAGASQDNVPYLQIVVLCFERNSSHSVPGNLCQFVGTDLLCARLGSGAADGGMVAALDPSVMDERTAACRRTRISYQGAWQCFGQTLSVPRSRFKLRMTE